MAAVAGRTYPAVSFEIDSERVASFARAIGADPDDGVPPTFATVYSLGVTAPQLFGDEDAAVDFARLLRAEQEFEWQRAARGVETVASEAAGAPTRLRRLSVRFAGMVVPGDTVTFSAEPIGAGRLDIRAANQRGEAVLTKASAEYAA